MMNKHIQSIKELFLNLRKTTPDSIDIIEAVTENNILSSSYRSSEKLIVTDGLNLVYFPPNGENEQKFSESVKRPLKTSDAEDKKIIKRLVEKAVDINIRKATGKRMMQGLLAAVLNRYHQRITIMLKSCRQ